MHRRYATLEAQREAELQADEAQHASQISTLQRQLDKSKAELAQARGRAETAQHELRVAEGQKAKAVQEFRKMEATHQPLQEALKEEQVDRRRPVELA